MCVRAFVVAGMVNTVIDKLPAVSQEST